MTPSWTHSLIDEMRFKKFPPLPLRALVSAIVVLAAGVCGNASAEGLIPSCYDSKLAVPAQPQAKEIFVVIDQTTLLDADLKQAVANQVRPFIAPGNNFSVLVFSAFTQGKYTQLLSTGQLEHVLPTSSRDDISKTRLTKLDQCIKQQPALAAQALGESLRGAFSGSSGDIAKSDVLGSLRDIAGKVRQSQAREKVVLLVSDMLENSSVSSFYLNQNVRRIEPERELKLVAENQLFADFSDARIYVMGAGLLSSDAASKKVAYRDPKTMQALASFWTSYFDKSKAQLVEFGQPALLNQIK